MPCTAPLKCKCFDNVADSCCIKNASYKCRDSYEHETSSSDTYPENVDSLVHSSFLNVTTLKSEKSRKIEDVYVKHICFAKGIDCNCHHGGSSDYHKFKYFVLTFLITDIINAEGRIYQL